MKNNNYYVVQGWMVTEYQLKGLDLQIFAIVYGLTQDEGGRFFGSISYLEEWTGAAKRTIIYALQRLTDQGLLEKNEYREKGVKHCSYIAQKPGANNDKSLVQNLHQPGAKSALGPGAKIAPNNIVQDITEDNKKKESKERSGAAAPASFPPKGLEGKRFSKPSVQDVAAYCKERGNGVDAEAFCDFYESKGWRVGSQPMKDWRAAVRTWERRDDRGPHKVSTVNPQQEDPQPRSQPKRPEDYKPWEVVGVTQEQYQQYLDHVAEQEKKKQEEKERLANIPIRQKYATLRITH